MTRRGPTAAGGRVASGDTLLVTRAPLDVAGLLADLTNARLGATAAFVGSVRSPNGGRDVAHLEYEAYEEMAVAEMLRIVTELRPAAPAARDATLEELAQPSPVAADPSSRVVIAHRLGRVVPGEASLVVAVATPHRAQALTACAELVEACKARLPIWKLEVLADGARRYVPGVSGAAPPL